MSLDHKRCYNKCSIQLNHVQRTNNRNQYVNTILVIVLSTIFVTQQTVQQIHLKSLQALPSEKKYKIYNNLPSTESEWGANNIQAKCR